MDAGDEAALGLRPVRVDEVEGPAAGGLSWYLLTTLPVETAEQPAEAVRLYRLLWQAAAKVWQGRKIISDVLGFPVGGTAPSENWTTFGGSNPPNADRRRTSFSVLGLLQQPASALRTCSAPSRAGVCGWERFAAALTGALVAQAEAEPV